VSVHHSIIIAHRARQVYLSACLRSIAWSAAVCSIDDFEVIVCNGGRDVSAVDAKWCKVVYDDSPMPIFNKSRLLNRGIDEARGEVLTFLDADAIVGPRWILGAVNADWSEIHRLCYRVRYVSEAESRDYLAGRSDLDFAMYDDYQLAYEAYGTPNQGRGGTGQPWGNSQFSIHRDRLGDFRYDEKYIGRGFEDLDILNRMARLWGKDYRARITTRGVESMYHLKHGYATDWRNGGCSSANARRFIGVAVSHHENADRKK
jgi:glycosyltransferase involved in cell wall biosynthesis